MIQEIDVVVVGGGRAGAAIAYAFGALGKHALEDFVVLDAGRRAGGTAGRSWSARPARSVDDLAILAVPGFTELGLAEVAADPDLPWSDAVSAAFGRYEDAYDLYVARPARVLRVERRKREDRLAVHAVVRGTPREYRARVVVTATGSRSAPFVPWVPGRDGLGVPQAHVSRVASVDDVPGSRVLVVGEGADADGLAAALVRDGRVVRRASTRPGADRLRAFERGAAIVADASDATGVAAAGAGSSLLEVPVDAVVWATGGRPALRHLAPLGLRDVHLGRRAAGGWSRLDRRIGFAPWAGAATAAETLERAVALVEVAVDRVDESPGAPR